MSRRRETDYAGAAGRVTLQAAARLGRRYVAMLKSDGVYARIVCDSVGRAAHFFYRSGRQVPDTLTDGIRGEVVGYPHAELCAELEAHTEAAARAIAARGHRLAHAFDLVHDGQRSLLREPFAVRRDVLQRMRTDIIDNGPRRSWERDASGRAHGRGDGRFVAPGPEGWRTVPILEVYPLARLEELWGELVVREGGEGLVLCAVDAPVGRRRAKLKLKPLDTLDCKVVSVDKNAALVAAGSLRFVVHAGAAADRELRPGDWVEVRHERTYASGIPKHARLVRARPDLQGVTR